MARSNLQIKVGTYTGDGTDNRNITGVGFRPSVVIVKGGSNLIVCKTRSMVGDVTCILGAASSDVSDRIQEILNDGFQVGTNAQVNATGTVYTYIAIYGTFAQQYFKSGIYTGDGTTPRTFTVGGITFTPTVAFCMGVGSTGKVFRTTQMTAVKSARLDANPLITSSVLDLIANGISIGSSTTVNGSGTVYRFFAMKDLGGVIKVGTYTGDGTDNRNITGVGFRPDVVLVKGDNANVGVLRTSSQTGDDTLKCSAAASAADIIQALQTDGFQLGTDVTVNNVGDTYYYVALRAGDFNTPLTRQVV
jgi:hypothetical protein